MLTPACKLGVPGALLAPQEQSEHPLASVFAPPGRRGSAFLIGWMNFRMLLHFTFLDDPVIEQFIQNVIQPTANLRKSFYLRFRFPGRWLPYHRKHFLAFLCLRPLLSPCVLLVLLPPGLLFNLFGRQYSDVPVPNCALVAEPLINIKPIKAAMARRTAHMKPQLMTAAFPCSYCLRLPINSH